MSVAERKTETINLRLSPRMKDLLRVVAQKEHRTLSNMIEALVINYCESNGVLMESEKTIPHRAHSCRQTKPSK